MTGGYGKSGVPDIVACVNGRFVGVECKANGNKATELQKKNLQAIADNCGVALIVDEASVGVFALVLDMYVSSSLSSGILQDLTGVSYEKTTGQAVTP